MTRLAVIACGGGVQSTAMTVLAAQGQLPHGPYAASLFCNVGDDSEEPATLEYVRTVLTPWAAERGLPVHELHKVNTRGKHKGPETLFQRLTREGSRSLPIPVRMSNGAPGTRNCTAYFKIGVMGKWVKAHGASKDNPATVAIGISTDEIERAGRGKNNDYERRVYPLIDLGLNRTDCANVIRDAGLPVPPKSSCWFCPFHRPSTWREMRRDRPEMFEKAAQLEDLLNERRDMLGRDHVYLTRFGKPIREAIAPEQPSLFADPDTGIGEGGCDEGVCFV